MQTVEEWREMLRRVLVRHEKAVALCERAAVQEERWRRRMTRAMSAWMRASKLTRLRGKALLEIDGQVATLRRGLRAAERRTASGNGHAPTEGGGS